MQLPKGKNELNWNTVIQTVTFLVLVIGLGATWGFARSDIDNHGVRLDAVEVETRKIPNIEYRVGVQEQGTAAISRSVDELKVDINEQGADLRVIREILTRLERQMGSRRGVGRP